jgi:predicted Zn-dependent protease
VIDDAALDALRRAVAAAPDDIPLRLHLAQVLLESGAAQDAVAQAGAVLALDAANDDARRVMASAAC